ncbi:hypothetical protein GGI42DRAFT_323478 [Trichoderma sp. SZMC 28013]
MKKATCSRGSYVRDLEPILAICFQFKVKVISKFIGGDSSSQHVTKLLDIVAQIAKRQGYKLKITTISATMDRDFIKWRIYDSKVGPYGFVEPLLPEVVDGTVDIVAQMGAEPYHSPIPHSIKYTY